jgi:hypothetical protein
MVFIIAGTCILIGSLNQVFLLVTVQLGFAILTVKPGFNLSVTVQLGFASLTFEPGFNLLVTLQLHFASLTFEPGFNLSNCTARVCCSSC